MQRHRPVAAATAFSTSVIEQSVPALPRLIKEKRHVGRRQEFLDVRRMRDQARASAAALPEMRAANATDPANRAVRRIARAFHV
jgi:hypothetical protein